LQQLYLILPTVTNKKIPWKSNEITEIDQRMTRVE